MSGASALQHHVFFHVCSSWCSSDQCANATGPLNSSCFLAQFIPSIPLVVDKEYCVKITTNNFIFGECEGICGYMRLLFSEKEIILSIGSLLSRLMDIHVFLRWTIKREHQYVCYTTCKNLIHVLL